MKNLIISFLVISAFILTSCEVTTPTYDFNGKIFNTFQRPVKSASLELRKTLEGDALYTCTTDNEGNFSFTDVEEGSYYLFITATIYGSFYYSQAIQINKNLTNNFVIFGSSSVCGTVINSQTGYGLANASVAFTIMNSGQQLSTIDTLPTHADFYATTDAYGDFCADSVPSGFFCMIVRAEGFSPRIYLNIVIGSGLDVDLNNITIVQEVPVGSLRIILSWGQSPSDLDSHLTGPMTGSSERFHCYYGNRSPYSSDVNLDVDDVSSYGPETTTITALHNGMYRFSVYNYSNSDYDGCYGIYNSPASVELWDHTGLIALFTPRTPTGSEGNTWRVFEINASGSNYSITTLDSYVYSSGSGSVLKSNQKSDVVFNSIDF